MEVGAYELAGGVLPLTTASFSTVAAVLPTSRPEMNRPALKPVGCPAAHGLQAS